MLYTKDEYRLARDIFMRALRGVNEALGVFYELDLDSHAADYYGLADGLADALDREGAWLRGEELLGLREAAGVLERLVGRAHERAV